MLGRYLLIIPPYKESYLFKLGTGGIGKHFLLVPNYRALPREILRTLPSTRW